MVDENNFPQATQSNLAEEVGINHREFIVNQSKSTVLGTFLNQNSLIYRYRY